MEMNNQVILGTLIPIIFILFTIGIKKDRWISKYKKKKQQRYDLAIWRVHKGIASEKDERIIKRFNK